MEVSFGIRYDFCDSNCVHLGGKVRMVVSLALRRTGGTQEDAGTKWSRNLGLRVYTFLFPKLSAKISQYFEFDPLSTHAFRFFLLLPQKMPQQPLVEAGASTKQ